MDRQVHGFFVSQDIPETDRESAKRPPCPANENPGALAGATGAEIEGLEYLQAKDTAPLADSKQNRCETCIHALRYRGDLNRHGSLDLAVPAFTRMCWQHSGHGEARVQLVNTWWTCRDWGQA